MASQPRLEKIIGAVNIGSFRVSAMIAGITEGGDMHVLGSAHRAAQGIRRGYVVGREDATFAVRDVLEKAEKIAGMNVDSVWVGTSGAGLTSEIRPVEIPIGGRRIEEEDIEHLLFHARESLDPDGRTILHAQPACYFLDGADGVANPTGLFAERLGVDLHVMLADGAPMRNVREAVERAHVEVDGVVATPLAAGYACLTAEERDLGVALIELGGEVTNVSVYRAGMLVGLKAIASGSADITGAIASAFHIRSQQAERIKCKHGSAIASPTDHRELIAVAAPGEEARGTDANNQVPRSDLIGVITSELDTLMSQIARELEKLGFTGGKVGTRARQVVITGGGAELPGLADYAQSVLGTSVRIGRPPSLRGLPEAHTAPGFATLAGLVLYAADDPVDIRRVHSRFTRTTRPGPLDTVFRVWSAMKEFF